MSEQMKKIDDLALKIMQFLEEQEVDTKTVAGAISHVLIYAMARLDPADGIDYKAACKEMSEHLYEAIIEARDLVQAERTLKSMIDALPSTTASKTIH